MSPTLLAALRRIERETRRDHAHCLRVWGDDGSRYPRDYYRPSALVRRYPWNLDRS